MNNILHSVFSSIFRLASPTYRKIKASGIFDPDFYLKANPDVAAQAGDPLMHYLREGWREERSARAIVRSSLLSQSISRATRKIDTEPLLHFITEGWRQGKKPNPYFDPLYYAQEQSDLDFAGINPLSHYIKKGWREGRIALYLFRSLVLSAEISGCRRQPELILSLIISGIGGIGAETTVTFFRCSHGISTGHPILAGTGRGYSLSLPRLRHSRREKPDPGLRSRLTMRPTVW